MLNNEELEINAITMMLREAIERGMSNATITLNDHLNAKKVARDKSKVPVKL